MPLSTSAKVLDGIWYLREASSAVDLSAIALATVGASLVLVTVILNVSDTVADPSLAVTFTAMVPTSEFVGVPEKVRVEALNESQEGSDEPLDNVAV